MIQKFLTKCPFALIILVSSNLLGQEVSNFSKYKELYPETPFVRLTNETKVTIKLEKGTIVCTQEHLKEDLFLKSNATNYGSKESIGFSYFFEILDIEAVSYALEDNKYKKYEVTEFKEKNNLDDSFYDDSKTLNFVYPRVGKGTHTVLNYTEKIKNPRFISTFYLADLFPIIKSKLTVVVDKDINLRFETFHLDSLHVKQQKRDIGKNIIYTWEINKTPEFKYETQIGSYRYILPHIVPIISSYNSKDGEVYLARNEGDLYQWYHGLTKDVNQDLPKDELQKLVTQLTEGKNNDFEKVKAIYYWVQQNIKYIAFEYALGGFVPREANDVFVKKYGDCKDNSSILDVMLKLAGIEGNLTWIGTRSIPYTYHEMPTPLIDNHMILTYTDGDNTYYLDATGRYVSINYPTSFIQGKEALVGNRDGTFEVKKVPVIPANQNTLVDHTNLFLENTILKGDTSVEISGYPKINMFRSLENISETDELLEYYNKRFTKGSNKFLIGEFTETNKFDYDHNFKLNFDFQLADYIKDIGNEVYVNLNLNKPVSQFRTDDDRKYRKEFDNQKSYKYVNVFEIPEGYQIDYMPESFNIDNQFVSASINYEIEDGRIKYEHHLESWFISLSKEEQLKVNALVKKIEKQYKEIIVLKKI
jgi:transglutaminase-like putative cysteine protease